MKDSEIISEIRLARHEFAALYGNDVRKISAAMRKIAEESGLRMMPIPVNPNFHYPKA